MGAWTEAVADPSHQPIGADTNCEELDGKGKEGDSGVAGALQSGPLALPERLRSLSSSSRSRSIPEEIEVPYVLLFVIGHHGTLYTRKGSRVEGAEIWIGSDLHGSH